MDTALNLQSATPTIIAAAPAVERAVTTKVTKLEKSDGAATLPSDRPFLAQAVAARIEDSDYPDPPAEIAPPERTLRPYDVPMLPFDKGEKGESGDAAALAPPQLEWIVSARQTA